MGESESDFQESGREGFSQVGQDLGKHPGKSRGICESPTGFVKIRKDSVEADKIQENPTRFQQDCQKSDRICESLAELDLMWIHDERTC